MRGIKLADGDEAVSMAVLRHVDADPGETRAYLKQAAAMRRAAGEEDLEADVAPEEAEEAGEKPRSRPNGTPIWAREQFILTVSERGFGKRSSAYEYRLANRGGMGISAMSVSKRNGPLVASFPVEDTDQLMLITNGGQTIRVPVKQIRVAGRATQGVTLFRTDGEERVVSVERIAEAGDAEG